MWVSGSKRKVAALCLSSCVSRQQVHCGEWSTALKGIGGGGEGGGGRLPPCAPVLGECTRTHCSRGGGGESLWVALSCFLPVGCTHTQMHLAVSPCVLHGRQDLVPRREVCRRVAAVVTVSLCVMCRWRWCCIACSTSLLSRCGCDNTPEGSAAVGTSRQPSRQQTTITEPSIVQILSHKSVTHPSNQVSSA